jgi:hypothetical protein
MVQGIEPLEWMLSLLWEQLQFFLSFIMKLSFSEDPEGSKARAASRRRHSEGQFEISEPHALVLSQGMVPSISST